MVGADEAAPYESLMLQSWPHPLPALLRGFGASLGRLALLSSCGPGRRSGRTRQGEVRRRGPCVGILGELVFAGIAHKIHTSSGTAGGAAALHLSMRSSPPARRYILANPIFLMYFNRCFNG